MSTFACCNMLVLCVYFYKPLLHTRGREFRTEFAHISEIRSVMLRSTYLHVCDGFDSYSKF